MPKTEYNIIGQRPARPDAIEKVTGQANFGADFTLPRMLHGKALRSDYAHARIISIDTSAAEKIDGVKAVVTGRDFDHIISLLKRCCITATQWLRWLRYL
jgi:CO/xanthine dehydrogenase Mo-binding subunit